MNKIYTKIWNRGLEHWAVASELASGDGSSVVTSHRRSVKRSLLAVSVALLLSAASATSWAADAVCMDPVTGLPNGTPSGTGNEVACGEGAVASGPDAIAIGTNSVAAGRDSIAIGTQASAGANQTVAVGGQSAAEDLGSAFGFLADAGYNSVSVGRLSSAFAESVAVGPGATTSNSLATAVGFNAIAGGYRSSALGTDARAMTSISLALGNGAIANVNAGDVALGAGSVTAAPNPTAGTTIDGTAYSFAGAAPTSVVSVGAAGAERQVTNVAAGRISATSTDAINGSQLYATNQAIENLAITVDASATHYYSVNDNGVVGGNYNNDGATGINSLAAGVGASAAGAGSTAVGTRANAAGFESTAVGAESTAQDRGSAFGQLATAGNNSVAVGRLSNAFADSVAVGPGAATGDALATAVGFNAVANGPRATALGVDARADVFGALALGNGATANASAGDVALGSGSVTSAPNPTASTVIDGTTYAFAGTSPTSVVSVGAAGAERQVTNVAAGRISGTSTDAINGSQLFATNTAIENLSIEVDANATHYYSVNDNGVVGGNYANDGATGINAIASGVNAGASAADAVAIGTGATAGTANSVALGAGSTTATAVGTASTTIADTTYNFAGATPTGTVSVGDVGAERTVTNVAAGRISATSTDAVNGSQLHATNQAVNKIDTRVTNIEESITNINNGSTGMFQVSGDNTVAPSPTGTDSAAGGANAVASGDNSTSVGNSSTASGTGSSAFGNGATASGNNSVAIGAGSVASADNTVSVGTVGGERTITNVAAGVNDTDAVNVSQLKGFTDGGVQYDKNEDGTVNYNSVTLNPGGTGETTIRNVAAGVDDTDAVNVSQLTTGLNNTLIQANTYTDNRVNQLQNDIWYVNGRVGDLEQDMHAGVASAMAMRQAPYVAGKTTYYAGAAAYKGQGALGVSLRRTADTGRWSLEGGVSANRDGGGVYVGLSGVLGD